MTVTCPSITVTPAPTGANITATSITPSVTACQAVCSLTVNITWTNTGTVSGTFIPGIQVGTSPVMTLPSEALAAGANITKTFSITGLPVGNFVICPVPN